MIYIDLIFNLALLVALSVVSGFIEQRLPRHSRFGILMQGVLFGGAAVIGMLRPLDLGSGLIFDGRSVMVSLCALFYGPLSVFLAVLMTIGCRVWIGGVGMIMGVIVILLSAGIGLITRFLLKPEQEPPSTFHLYLFGLAVHLAMVATMFTLPSHMAMSVMGQIGFPVMLLYPLATILVGKILSDQVSARCFITDLQKTKQNLDITLQSIGEAVISTCVKGNVVLMNPVAETLTGWKSREAQGKPIDEVFNIVNAKTHECIADPVKKVLIGDCLTGFENHILLNAKNGSEYYITLSAAPICDSKRKIFGVVFVFRDVTEAHKAQESLRRSEERFQRALENIPDIVAIYSSDLKIQFINRNMSRFTRHPVSEFSGKCDEQIWLMEVHQIYLPMLQRALETGFIQFLDTDLLIPSMGIRNLNIRCVPLFDETGNVQELMTITQDLTEQKQKDKEYKELIDGMNDAVFVIDFEGNFVEVNKAAVEVLGYSRNELLSMGPMDIDSYLSTEDIKDLGESIKLHNKHIFETLHKTKNGNIIPMEISSSQLTYGGNQVVLSIARDITERKEAESEYERLIAAIEHAGETIFITDPDGTIEYVNPAFEQITGYKKEEVIGQTPRILKSGHQGEMFYREMWNTISSGETWQGRMVNKRKDDTFYTEEATISSIKDNSGKIINYVAVAHDITEHLRLMAQFQQAQKMESVGRLAGGIAHDYNNILSVIIGFTELAMDKVDPNELLYEDLQEILRAANRSVDITRQLLAFARKQVISPKVLNLNETVESMLKMLRRLIGENIELAWMPETNLWPVKMDPAQVEQILANMCVNARDAIKNIGKINIKTQNKSFDNHFNNNQAGTISGDYVVLSISDNGNGMDKETLDKIFDPFFTTKEIGQGTGLGLATVYGIVNQNNGFINVFSKPGKGTTFKIYLLRHPDNLNDFIETSVKSTLEVVPISLGEKVLVVEDEVSILKLAETILISLGYSVLTANTPNEAIRLARNHTGEIHLLMTDVVMPDINGWDLADRLLSFYPNLKCLFMSGYTTNVIADRGVLDEGIHFIQKPFSKKELAAKMREILD
jgi:two-component system, cell cycle sensor histidine kinase and response regulator CckA